MKWADALKDAILTTVETPDKGFKTMQQISEEIGKSIPRTCALMGVATKCGNVEMKSFRIKTGQVIRPVPHYRLK